MILGKIFVVADRDIKKDEEIYVNYGFDYWRPRIKIIDSSNSNPETVNNIDGNHKVQSSRNNSICSLRVKHEIMPWTSNRLDCREFHNACLNPFNSITVFNKSYEESGQTFVLLTFLPTSA